MSIYATDYTESPDFVWAAKCPPRLQHLGRVVVLVELFDEDVQMAEHMSQGQIYTFSNMRLNCTPVGYRFKSGVMNNSCKIDLSHDDEAKSALLTLVEYHLLD